MYPLELLLVFPQLYPLNPCIGYRAFYMERYCFTAIANQASRIGGLAGYLTLYLLN